MMMEVVLHDRDQWRKQLLPFAFTRPVGAFRIGVLTLQEKWQLLLDAPVSFFTEPYLQGKFHGPSSASQMYLVLRADLCPTAELITALVNLTENSLLEQDGDWIAYKLPVWTEEPDMHDLKRQYFEAPLKRIRFLEDIYLQNAEQIHADFELLKKDSRVVDLHTSNVLIGEEDQLFIGADVQAYCCTLNTTGGPIYIGAGAVLEEGCHLRGPIAIGTGARIKMGACLYPNVSVGPRATAGGEVNNTVMWADSAKGHDGYLGCAVIGEGCNLGAGTSNSNLQNNWKPIKLYDYSLAGWRATERKKIGLFMGDFAMCGIHSSITTGAVIGVGAQVTMSNIIPKFVPDFAWWTDRKQEVYHWRQFEEMIDARAKARAEAVDDHDMGILWEVHNLMTGE